MRGVLVCGGFLLGQLVGMLVGWASDTVVMLGMVIVDVGIVAAVLYRRRQHAPTAVSPRAAVMVPLPEKVHERLLAIQGREGGSLEQLFMEAVYLLDVSVAAERAQARIVVCYPDGNEHPLLYRH